MSDFHSCVNCVYCMLYRLKTDPTGKYEGSVDADGYWYNKVESLRCITRTLISQDRDTSNFILVYARVLSVQNSKSIPTGRKRKGHGGHGS